MTVTFLSLSRRLDGGKSFQYLLNHYEMCEREMEWKGQGKR